MDAPPVDLCDNSLHLIDGLDSADMTMGQRNSCQNQRTTPATRISQMSKLRESRLEDQVDYNVDKIMHILCKILMSEVTNELAAYQRPTGQRHNMIVYERPYEEQVPPVVNSNPIIPETVAMIDEATSKSLVTSQDDACKIIMNNSTVVHHHSTKMTQSLDYTKKSVEEISPQQQPPADQSPEIANRNAETRRSSQSSMQKIYGVLSQRQKEVIRESMKAKNVMKKENVHRVGAYHSGRRRFRSPYAIDQEKNVIQSKVQIVQDRPYANTIAGPLDMMAREMKIQRERQYLLPEFQPIMSQQ